MKIVAILLIVGIFLPCIPMLPMGDCSEENHVGGLKVNGVSSFHCPLCTLIVNATLSEPLPLPLIGQLPSTECLRMVDDLTRSIFRPPEYGIPNAYSMGMKEIHRVAVEYLA